MTVEAAPHPQVIKAVPVRHRGRWLSAVVVVAIFGWALYRFVTAPRLQWDAVGHWLAHHSILLGALGTLELTAIAMVVGIVLGVLVALMRLSSNPVLSSVSWFYIWFFRGTPVLVQLWFWWNLQLILPYVGIGVPFTNLFWQAHTETLITPFLAAILGLGLNEGAYMAEIVRAGILSVEQGQTDAAQALGMRSLLVLRRIILPQAMRVIIPPTGNETISMLKTSSLAYIVTFRELFYTQTLISASNYQVEELLIVASLWYLAFTSIATIGQFYLERYFARGSVKQLPETPIQRLRRLLTTFHAPPPAPPIGPLPSSGAR